MGTFLGWKTYDLPRYCKVCGEFYEEEDEYCHAPHEDCSPEDEEDESKARLSKVEIEI